jgi:hypothetical protein
VHRSRSAFVLKEKINSATLHFVFQSKGCLLIESQKFYNEKNKKIEIRVSENEKKMISDKAEKQVLKLLNM